MKFSAATQIGMTALLLSSPLAASGLPAGDEVPGLHYVDSLTALRESQEQEMDEVVVVGYGTQKRTHQTGSVAKVSSAVFENNRTSTLDGALGGTVAGLNVVSSGQPGGSSIGHKQYEATQGELTLTYSKQTGVRPSSPATSARGRPILVCWSAGRHGEATGEWSPATTTTALPTPPKTTTSHWPPPTTRSTTWPTDGAPCPSPSFSTTGTAP